MIYFEDHELLKDLFLAMNDGLAICELIFTEKKQPDDLRYLKVNPAFEKFVGIQAEILQGKIGRDLDAMDFKWAESIRRVALFGEVGLLEDDSSDSRRWIELRKFRLGEAEFAIFLVDITERIKLQEQLDAKSELLMVTLNALDEGVIVTDQAGRISLINQAAAELCGYSVDEIIGELFSKIFYIFDDQTSEPFIPDASEKAYSNLILATKDLKEIPINMNTSFYPEPNGQITGTLMIIRDISEKQKIEQELRKQNKLESLGVLASGIAHDFNNVLSAILSNIQLAIVKQRKNIDISKYLLHTVEITRKASDLTKQLLTFARGGAPVKKDSSLIELIKDTTCFVLRGTKTKAEFVIPDDLWAACIDVSQISQVVHNLVLNAQQAMPKGGIIRINAENMIINKDKHLHSGKYIKITIQDQGVGIPKEHLSKIFDPFFTTKKDGNGLGLATSYSIIQQHNGFIEVHSQLEVGTFFDIYLPALDQIIIEAETQREIASLGESLKLLLMDDEEEILNSVGEMLEYYGHRVVLTKNGNETIEIYKDAKTKGEPFDVLIMDLTIPGGMGGQEVMAHLRDIDPHVKAIVSSGYANDPIMADYERFGFSGVVSKPYKYGELQEVLKQMVAFKQNSLELGF